MNQNLKLVARGAGVLLLGLLVWWIQSRSAATTTTTSSTTSTPPRATPRPAPQQLPPDVPRTSPPARPPTPITPTATATPPTASPSTADLNSIRDAAEREQVRSIIEIIDAGGPFRYSKDGSTWQNRERRLPKQRPGHYREYTVDTPGSDDRGARRIIAGAEHELYYTRDHYDSFTALRPASTRAP